jgi:hypothetical protein
MTTAGAPDRSGPSERLYAGLLRIYPAAFRERYRGEMVRLFADQLRDARAGRGAGGVVITWLRTLPDLVLSAAGEHLRKDRTVAQSLATFEPTRSMRVLGLLAIIGGLLLLWAFVSWNPFVSIVNNTVRLVWFALSGAAVGLAFHARQAAVAPRLAIAATAVVVIAGAWYATTNLLSLNSPRSWAAVGGLIYSLSSFTLFASAGVFGAISLRIGAIWRGMSRWWAAVARLAAVALLVGGPLATLGDDRWGLTDNADYGALITQATLAGVFMTGAGWLVLGLVLVLGDRGKRLPAA